MPSIDAYIAAHPQRVYLIAWGHRDISDARGLQWDEDFPHGGQWFVPPQLTADLRRWRGKLPEDVQAGGAAAARHDADVANVEVTPQGLPLHTYQWVYFRDGATLKRRRRRWTKCGEFHHQPFVELLTQREYNRRVEDPGWPRYKPDEEYDEDGAPEWHGGGGYIMPEVALDRVERGADLNHGWESPLPLYAPWAVDTQEHRGYRDKDEVVRKALAVAGSTAGRLRKRPRVELPKQVAAEVIVID